MQGTVVIPSLESSRGRRGWQPLKSEGRRQQPGAKGPGNNGLLSSLASHTSSLACGLHATSCCVRKNPAGTKTKPEAGMLFHPKKMDLGPRTGICSLEGSHIPAENTTKAFSHFSWKEPKNENASASCNLLMDSPDKQR